MPAPILSSFRKQTISNVFIGIDFGTSYTKVSYSYAPTQVPQIETIKWDNDFFKQTVLYVQDERLFFEKPTGNFKEVKYFKYSIIEKKLKNTAENTVNNFEEMCCVYFLAQVIKRSLKIIQQNLNISNLDDIKVSINMGVPLENFYEDANKNNKGLYQEILEDAILLAGGSRIRAEIPENQVLISNLDSVYSEILQKKAILKWAAHVYPELAAELLLYHQSKFVADGVYAIIDVGGGTVDMALFQKETSGYTKNPYMYCLAQKVLPYGVEILQESSNSVSADQFKIEFSSMLMNSKDYLGVNYTNYKKLDVFFLGGGAGNPWYSNNIESTKNRLRATVIPPLEFARSIEEFIPSEEMLLQKNQRLIISQMLARHHDDIDSVRGFPDFYQSEKASRPKGQEFDMESYLSEKGDKYRD